MGYPSFYENILEKLSTDFTNHFASATPPHDIETAAVQKIVQRLFDQSFGAFLEDLTNPDLDLAKELQQLRARVAHFSEQAECKARELDRLRRENCRLVEVSEQLRLLAAAHAELQAQSKRQVAELSLARKKMEDMARERSALKSDLRQKEMLLRQQFEELASGGSSEYFRKHIDNFFGPNVRRA